MADAAAISRVVQQLKRATSFTEVFGTMPPGTAKAQKHILRRKFGALAQMVHPDYAPSAAKSAAEEAFALLNDLRHRAETAIEAGVFSERFSLKRAVEEAHDVFEIRSPLGAYRLRSVPYAQGDFSVLYRGKAVASSLDVIVKIAAEPVSNAWLEREAMVLGKFAAGKSGSMLARVSRYVPQLLDTFLIEGEKRSRYRVNVLREVPGLVSVADIVAAYPRGLNPPEAAWVFRRMIAQTVAAKMVGVVHGAMTPDHILVDPYKHEPMHIGWSHAIDVGLKKTGRITHVIERYTSWYPPEVFDKKTPDHRTDLYMCGKTMIQLLGGDVVRNTLPPAVPDTVARLVLAMVQKSPERRPQDGALFLDEVTRVVRNEWGSTYRPLEMPIR